jgi:hypothetical protein
MDEHTRLHVVLPGLKALILSPEKLTLMTYLVIVCVRQSQGRLVIFIRVRHPWHLQVPCIVSGVSNRAPIRAIS